MAVTREWGGICQEHKVSVMQDDQVLEICCAAQCPELSIPCCALNIYERVDLVLSVLTIHTKE